MSHENNTSPGAVISTGAEMGLSDTSIKKGQGMSCERGGESQKLESLGAEFLN